MSDLDKMHGFCVLPTEVVEGNAAYYRPELMTPELEKISALAISPSIGKSSVSSEVLCCARVISGTVER